MFFVKEKLMEYKTIDDLGDLNGKVVMLRADLNVPMDENFHVTNTARIDRTVPILSRTWKRRLAARLFLLMTASAPKLKKPLRT